MNNMDFILEEHRSYLDRVNASILGGRLLASRTLEQVADNILGGDPADAINILVGGMSVGIDWRDPLMREAIGRAYNGLV